jgi:AcrR family transcriptional regulator
MPRVRADDYDDKKGKILDAAAKLFASHGYAGARMDEIATACGVSKSMLYHYFKKKEDVLADILQEHVSSLIESISTHIRHGPDGDRFEYFRKFTEVYLNPSSTARASHVVALHDMRYLTPRQRKKQVKLERQLLELIETVLREVKAGDSHIDYRVSAFLLIGMLNWVELWYDESGQISAAKFYEKITRLFLTGFLERGSPNVAP